MAGATWVPTGVGAAWWLVVVTVGGVAGRVSLVHALLLLAVAVIVPAAVPLHPVFARWSPWVVVAAGVPVGPSIVAQQGSVAAVLCVPWVAVAVAAALRALMWWLRQSDWFAVIAWPAAAAYLAVGAAWTLADRLALEPAGVGPPFVALTAVDGRSRLLTLSWVTVRRVVPAVDGMARVLLTVSAVAVVLPMLLAVQWAVGTNLGTPALSIAAMARWHGVVNAVGFSLCGVVGWRLVRVQRT